MKRATAYSIMRGVIHLYKITDLEDRALLHAVKVIIERDFNGVVGSEQDAMFYCGLCGIYFSKQGEYMGSGPKYLPVC